MGMGQVQNDFQLTRNFNLREFICPHCGAVIIHPRLVNLLQKIRDKVNKPVNVISGYRCAERNKAVGGAFNSYHMVGMAADIYVKGVTGKELADIINAEFYEEVGGMGIAKNAVHIDIRPHGRPRWTY